MGSTVLRLMTGGIAIWAALAIGRVAWGRMSHRARNACGGIAGYAALVLLGLLFLAPFGWMLSTSLKADAEVFLPEVRWLPTLPTARVATLDESGVPVTLHAPVRILRDGQRVAVLGEMEDGQSRVRPLDRLSADGERVVANTELRDSPAFAPQWYNYPDALNSFPFWQYTLNTLVVCLLTMLGTVVSSALPAYGFARLKWVGRDGLFFLLVATLMLPPQVTMLPVFLLFRYLGWTGTILPLVAPSFLGPAFYIFLLRQFFLTVPLELSDAARLDGCGELGILWRVLAPLARPALATVALLSFTAAWMDFTGPLMYLHDDRTYTLAVGLLAFLGRHNNEWSLLMAASAVMTLPMLLLFFFAQRTFVRGIAAGGLKG